MLHDNGSVARQALIAWFLLLGACGNSALPIGDRQTQRNQDNQGAEQDAGLYGGRDAATSIADDSGLTMARDAAADSGNDPCPNGDIVNTMDECPADEAFCTLLADGRYCTGPNPLQCPPGATPITNDAHCPTTSSCQNISVSLRCEWPEMTFDDCVAAGGYGEADPGDGSLFRSGCSGSHETLGTVNANFTEGGLCCLLNATDCAPDHIRFIDTGCTPPDPSTFAFFWNGRECKAMGGCLCDGGGDCTGYATLEACQSHYMFCLAITTPCRSNGGATPCANDEFCAFPLGSHCGSTADPTVCVPRPTSCDATINMMVCGCDGQTYENECEANAAGTAILPFDVCHALND